MTTSTYTVVGMTCGHCVASVREEVSEVAGVQSVDVDLDSGRLAVTGEGFDERAVSAAVEEAGYELAPGRLTATPDQRARMASGGHA